MADDKRGQNEKATERKMPAGATNLHKNMATGMGRDAAESKALTKEQVEKKER